MAGIVDQIGTGIGSAATSAITGDTTPADKLGQDADKADLLTGGARAGVRVAADGNIDALKEIVQIYKSAGPKGRVALLEALYKATATVAEYNPQLRKLKQEGKLEIFKQREVGYQQTAHEAEKTLYNTMLEVRKSAASGQISTTSLKGLIAEWAFAINELMGGTFGDMPIMKKWKEEASAFKLNTSDIAKPKRADIDFKEQPDALIAADKLVEDLEKILALSKKGELAREGASMSAEGASAVRDPSRLLGVKPTSGGSSSSAGVATAVSPAASAAAMFTRKLPKGPIEAVAEAGPP